MACRFEKTRNYRPYHSWNRTIRRDRLLRAGDRIDRMTSCRPRLYTIRFPSGDQLGKPVVVHQPRFALQQPASGPASGAIPVLRAGRVASKPGMSFGRKQLLVSTRYDKLRREMPLRLRRSSEWRLIWRRLRWPDDLNPFIGVTKQSAEQPMRHAQKQQNSDLKPRKISEKDIRERNCSTQNAHVEPPSHPAVNPNMHGFVSPLLPLQQG